MLACWEDQISDNSKRGLENRTRVPLQEGWIWIVKNTSLMLIPWKANNTQFKKKVEDEYWRNPKTKLLVALRDLVTLNTWGDKETILVAWRSIETTI